MEEGASRSREEQKRQVRQHSAHAAHARPFPKGTVPFGGSNVPLGSAPKPTMCPLGPPQNQLILAAT